jgi:O-methyltransferase
MSSWECGWQMYVNKQRNKFITEQYRDLATEFDAMFGPDSFVGDDMLVHNCNRSFMHEKLFVETFEEVAKAPIYQQMAWRMHVLDFFLKHALRADGNYVECGVFRGFKSYFLLKKNAEQIKDRKKFLFDTFKGIDPSLADGSPIKRDEHAKDGLYEFVVERFSEFENLEIIRGSVPLSLQTVDVGVVNFVHLDMNSWQAELGALDYFLPKMVPGGVIILDDFGLKTHRKQFEKEYPFLVERGLSVLELPTGQGVVLL